MLWLDAVPYPLRALDVGGDSSEGGVIVETYIQGAIEMRYGH
jgi:hypothetical protein